MIILVLLIAVSAYAQLLPRAEFSLSGPVGRGFGGLPPLPPIPRYVPALQVSPYVAAIPRPAASATFPYFGPRNPYFRPCPPSVRPSENDACKWTALRDEAGCLIRYKCEPVEPTPKPCPPAPVRPDLGLTCNWIPIQDKEGCIIHYQCEPLPPPPCPTPPESPDQTGNCKWIPIKDTKGCINSYSCEPIARSFSLFNRARQPRFGGPFQGFPASPFGAPFPSAFPGLPYGPVPLFGGLPSPLPGPFQDADEDAADSHPLCCFWASNGQCAANPAYMIDACPHACSEPSCGGDLFFKKKKK